MKTEKCFLCFEDVNLEGGLNVPFYEDGANLLCHILELPNLELKSVFLKLTYCLSCKDEIKKVRSILEELENLEKIILSRKTEIETQLRKTYQRNHHLRLRPTENGKVESLPVGEFREEIVTELNSRRYLSTLTKIRENRLGKQFYPCKLNEAMGWNLGSIFCSGINKLTKHQNNINATDQLHNDNGFEDENDGFDIQFEFKSSEADTLLEEIMENNHILTVGNITSNSNSKFTNLGVNATDLVEKGVLELSTTHTPFANENSSEIRHGESVEDEIDPTQYLELVSNLHPWIQASEVQKEENEISLAADFASTFPLFITTKTQGKSNLQDKQTSEKGTKRQKTDTDNMNGDIDIDNAQPKKKKNSKLLNPKTPIPDNTVMRVSPASKSKTMQLPVRNSENEVIPVKEKVNDFLQRISEETQIHANWLVQQEILDLSTDEEIEKIIKPAEAKVDCTIDFDLNLTKIKQDQFSEEDAELKSDDSTKIVELQNTSSNSNSTNLTNNLTLEIPQCPDFCMLEDLTPKVLRKPRGKTKGLKKQKQTVTAITTTVIDANQTQQKFNDNEVKVKPCPKYTKKLIPEIPIPQSQDFGMLENLITKNLETQKVMKKKPGRPKGWTKQKQIAAVTSTVIDTNENQQNFEDNYKDDSRNSIVKAKCKDDLEITPNPGTKLGQKGHWVRRKWKLHGTYDSVQDAEAIIHEERTWVVDKIGHTNDGTKTYFRCCKVPRIRKNECTAGIYLLSSPESTTISMFRSTKPHGTHVVDNYTGISVKYKNMIKIIYADGKTSPHEIMLTLKNMGITNVTSPQIAQFLGVKHLYPVKFTE